MKELSIFFVDSINESLLDNFKDTEQIKDYFEINKFKANKNEILIVPKPVSYTHLTLPTMMSV